LIDRGAFSEVYEPREDSFLFLDALDSDKEFLRSVSRTVILEIGPGSGIVSTHLSSILDPECGAVFLACDINPSAARVTEQTFRNNNSAGRPHVMQCVVGDLCSPFLSRLAGKVSCLFLGARSLFYLNKKKVDVLLFNPPYVPTDDEEVGHADLRAAWAGGLDGMMVTSRFLPSVSGLLSPCGACYVVFVAENNPLDVAREMAEKWMLMPKQIAKRTAKNERLSVWRFTHRRAK
jgi:release factor glutamine methyltransferase